MLKPRKIPQRMCVGCREMKSKRELTRIVRSPEGEVSIDFTGKKPGRGAYLCPSEACLNKAIKIKAFERAFEITVSPDIFANLREQLSNGSS